MIAFDSLYLFLNNKKQLLQYTNVFSLYFPPLFKLLAWFPHTYQRYKIKGLVWPHLEAKGVYIHPLIITYAASS